MKAVASFDELREFAKPVQFPSHALVLRPNDCLEKDRFFKGIVDFNQLEVSFKTAKDASRDQSVWVETDMRITPYCAEL